MQEKPFTIIPTPGESATTVRVQDEFGGPVTAVTFGRADGTMTLQYVGTTPVLRVKDYLAIGPLSPNNDHNKGGCPNYVGRDGGGYCKSGTTVTFSVAAPRYLQNARGDVIGGGGLWSESWQPPTISVDGLTASYGRANWGSPINPTVRVDIFEHLSSVQCGENQVTPVLLGQQTVFNIPSECLPIASIQWKTFKGGNSGAVSVGQSSPTGPGGGVDASRGPYTKRQKSYAKEFGSFV